VHPEFARQRQSTPPPLLDGADLTALIPQADAGVNGIVTMNFRGTFYQRSNR
jgi:hypothetical protein